MRIEQLRGKPIEREGSFTFSWDGREIVAYPGETILGALLANNVHTVRQSRIDGEPRGMLCGIGICYECLVTVNGAANRRACVTPAAPGMRVEQQGPFATDAQDNEELTHGHGRES
jgi:predicted molibdopterin-dependent oxidoreductase YjgC